MTGIPKETRDKVIAAIYADCDALKWEQLSAAEKSRVYERWIKDPRVGGELNKYIPLDRIRVWIKDGPAKEYGRALSGLNSYARHTSRQASSPTEVVQAVLGAAWTVVADTLEDKPNRCKVTDGSTTRDFIWGPLDSLKDLVWAAVQEKATKPASDPLVTVVRPQGDALTSADREKMKAIAKAAGLDIVEGVTSITAKPESVDG